ncbi:MAG: peptide ABC transporter substrate-binding protein [Anaerolineae bacterium]
MKKLFLFAVVATLLALAVVGCTTPVTPAAPAAPATVIVQQTVIVQGTPQIVEKVVTATPVPPTAAPTKAPVAAKDTIVLGMAQEPDTLNPFIGSMMARTLVTAAIFSGCVSQDEKTNWVPMLCESVPTLDNGGAVFTGTGADQQLVVTFKFKAGLKYHDGTPFKASDEVFGWKTYMDPDFPATDRSFAYKIYKIEAPDDLTYKVTFMSENQAHQAAAGTLKGDVNFAAFKGDFGPDGMGFDTWKGPVIDPIYFTADYYMPEHILGKMKAADIEKSDFSKKPVGIGPYMLKEWQPAQQLTLTAVADSPLKPKIKNVVFRFITDSSSELAALQKGEIDGATQIGLDVDSSPDLDKLDKTMYRVDYTPGYQWEHLDLNTTAFPFDNVHVRKALAYATNKKEITDKLYYGKVKPADSWLPDFHWAYGGDQLVRYDYSVDKAKAELTAAGYDCTKNPCVDKSGKKLEFTLITTDRKDRQALAQVLQAEWKLVNMGVNLQFLYGRGLFATCTSGTDAPLNCRTYQAAMYTWVSGDDPDVSSLYTCKSIPSKANGYSGQNTPGFCDKTFDQLSQQSTGDATIAISHAKRAPLVQQMQHIWTDAVPVIPLKANANVTVWSTHLKGATGVPTSIGETWNIASWEWVTQ